MKHAFKKIGARLANIWQKDLALRLVSLVFAIILWGYVLTVQNPQRVKNIKYVPVKFENEAELNARGLVVRGNRNEILKNIEADISVSLNNYSSVTAQDIQASIDLSAIGKPGVYTLKLNASSRFGTVQTNPAQINLEVDELAIKQVPVEVKTSGEVPDGYWKGDLQISSSQLELRGAKKDVERASKVVCTIPLDQRTTSYNNSFVLTIVDEYGVAIEPSNFISNIPAVNVKLEILPQKSVGLNVISAILGQDSLKANYQISSVTTKPDSVKIVGDKTLLDSIYQLDLTSINVTGASESVYSKVQIKVPTGIKIIGSSEVEVYVNIKEKTETEEFANIPITVVGLGKGYTADLSANMANVKVSGPYSQIKKLEREEILLSLDVTGLSTGQYILELKPVLPQGYTSDVKIEPVPSTVTVTIRK